MGVIGIVVKKPTVPQLSTYFSSALSHPTGLSFSGDKDQIATTVGSGIYRNATTAPHGLPGGKYYYEMRWITQAGVAFLGVGNETSDFTGTTELPHLGWSWRDGNGGYHAWSNFYNYYGNPGEFFVGGDIVMVALDLTLMTGVGGGKMYVGTNNLWAAGSNPETGTNPIFSDANYGLKGTLIRPDISTYWAGDSWEALLSTGDWNYTPPAGYGQLEA